VGHQELALSGDALEWTRQTAARLFKPGDVIEVEVRRVGDDGAPGDLRLEQPPAVEGGLVAIDNETGQIRAMVGGFSFARSKFNRAIQARRQVGSLFKTMVYTAAIDRGFTPVSVIVDEPISYEVGPDQPLYEPLNYDQEFKGPVTLRHAFEDSRNIPAVKLMAEVGPAEVVSYAKRFGFGRDYPPFLSLALGAAEATLMEITSAYSALPNRGVRMEPYSIVSIADREGNLLEERHPEGREALRADTAFIMTNLLRGVVQRGTGQAANSLNWPLGGKTGTMDEYTDAWFVGFDPRLTIGVWVGYDEKKTLGNGETGSAAALPIWIDVMRSYIESREDREHPPAFDAPGNIVYVPLASGLVEAFINGTQPTTPLSELPAFAPDGPDLEPVLDPAALPPAAE
jgi:penicillin-binding protein 1A